MRKQILLCLLLLNVLFAKSQQINQYQYWYDADYSSLQTISIAPVQDFYLNSQINVDILSNGLHAINMRFKATDDKWSGITTDYFYKTTGTLSNGEYQYWFDNDFVNAITVSINPKTVDYNLVANINATTLTNGYHNFNIRFRPIGGMWSSATTESFLKRGSDNTANFYIKRVKYWFDGDWQNAQQIIRASIQRDTITAKVDCENLSLGRHQICYQFMDNSGMWSGASCDSFLRAPILYKEFIEPKLIVAKGNCNIGDNQVVSGKDFVPDGEVVLVVKNSFNDIVNFATPLTYLDSGKFTFTFTVDTSFKGGEYKVYARDVTTGTISPEIKFWVNNVKYNTLTIRKPLGTEQYYLGQPIYITWRDFIKKDNPNGTTAFVTKHYKIEHSNDGGSSWQTVKADTAFTQLMPDQDNDQFSYTLTLNGSVPVANAKTKVTEVGNPNNTHTSDSYSAAVPLNNGFTTSLEWDKSCPNPTLPPIGLAADGTARIFVKLSRNAGNTTPINSIEATIKNITTAHTGTDMLGKIMYDTTHTTTYTDEANAADTTSIIQIFSSNTNNEYYFWLVAPDDFIQSDFNQWGSRKIKVEFKINGSTTPISTNDIEIVRPPLMFVHGLNSDATAFNDTKYKTNLGNTVYFDNDDKDKNPFWKVIKRITLYPNAGFMQNAEVILGVNGSMYDNSFIALLDKMRFNNKYASNRVDYVCHSMGGCVARTAINKFPNLFKANGGAAYNNYGKGFINKLITVNTPHNGSIIADFMVDAKNTKTITFLKNELAKYTTKKLDGFFNNSYTDISNAVKDLQLYDSGITFNQTVIKNHLIGSDIDKENNSNIAQIKLDLLGNGLRSICELANPSKTSIPAFFLTKYGNNEYWNNSDVVVPLTSQLANTPINSIDEITANNSIGNKARSVIYSKLDISGEQGQYTYGNNETKDATEVTHTAITENIIVGTRIMTLLNSSINSTRFADTIPANPNTQGLATYRVQMANSTTNYGDSILNYNDTLNVKIINPITNEIKYVDSTMFVNINVKDTSNLYKIQLMFQGEFYQSFSKANNQTFSIKIHSDAIGKNNLIVNAVYDSLGFTVNHYDSIMLNIKCNSQLTGFYIPQHTYILNKQQYFNIKFQPKYNNLVGTLNFDIDSLTKTIADTNVVRFDTITHQFITKDTGTTHIIFDYKGSKDTAFIFVSKPSQILTTLPINLIDFSGITQSCNSVLLKWRTAQEINSKGFEIEFSQNGLQFVKLKFIESSSVSGNGNNYNFLFSNLLNGRCYFRLKQIDLDGRFTYSNTISVSINCKEQQISVYPNPAQDILYFKGIGASKNNISILNSDGQKVMQLSSYDRQSINISTLPSGVYWLLINANQITFFCKSSN